MKKITKLIETLRQRRSYTRPYVLWGGLTIAACALIGMLVINVLVTERINATSEQALQRAELQAENKSIILSTWLDGIKSQVYRITKAELVQLFASEVNAEGFDDNNLRRQLVAQMPYMQQLLKEFMLNENMAEVLMLNRNGHAYIFGKERLALNPNEKQVVRQIFETGDTVVMPAQNINGSMILPVYTPVFTLEEGESPTVASVLASYHRVESALRELMMPGVLALQGETTVLLQKNEDVYTILAGGNLDAFKPFSPKVFPLVGGATLQQSPFDSQHVFISMQGVPGSPLLVSHQYRMNDALAQVMRFRNFLYSVALSALFALFCLLTAFVWYMLGQRNRNRVKFQEQVIEAMVRAVEIRDPYLSGHHSRLARKALQVGNLLNLPVEQRSALYYASMLSGIGKIFVPKDVLTKPGRLNAEERILLENHVHYAMDILNGIDFDLPISQLVQQMHERMDGSGYPRKLGAEEILPMARILGACDTYCALTEPRSYRARELPIKALEIMRKDAAKFDRQVLDVLEVIVQDDIARQQAKDKKS